MNYEMTDEAFAAWTTARDTAIDESRRLGERLAVTMLEAAHWEGDDEEMAALAQARVERLAAEIKAFAVAVKAINRVLNGDTSNEAVSAAAAAHKAACAA